MQRGLPHLKDPGTPSVGRIEESCSMPTRRGRRSRAGRSPKPISHAHGWLGAVRYPPDMPDNNTPYRARWLRVKVLAASATSGPEQRSRNVRVLARTNPTAQSEKVRHEESTSGCGATGGLPAKPARLLWADATRAGVRHSWSRDLGLAGRATGLVADLNRLRQGVGSGAGTWPRRDGLVCGLQAVLAGEPLNRSEDPLYFGIASRRAPTAYDGGA